jgi:hypothetical protein
MGILQANIFLSRVTPWWNHFPMIWGQKMCTLRQNFFEI